ncbi:MULTISPECIES: hypothetical protein [Dyella]|uniref:Lipoprotein n=2 Tax=Dyella TaxID=231454 RepID=A0A4V2NKU4_9GAMM|nr:MULTISPECIES: hypothetical protein [Dyella]TBR36048.1 hypothetical protein EYV96_15685 [Dyella terrae]TCI06098.1 hypothetical protein EZM97_34780 [Dyella soli]
MKSWLLLMAACVSLTACSSRPLTEAECRLVSEKEIDYAVSKVPPADADDMREHLLKAVDGSLDRCMSGKTYNRSEYKCMMKAKDSEAIEKCLAVVGKRLGH